jgi:hypothetical protein
MNKDVKYAIVFIVLQVLLIITLVMYKRDMTNHILEIETLKNQTIQDSITIEHLKFDIHLYKDTLQLERERIIFLNNEVARLHGRDNLSYFNN